MSKEHMLQQTEEGVTCAVCTWMWRSPPCESCPGAKRYAYESIPWDTLGTFTQLKRDKLKPFDQEKPDGCYYRIKDRNYIFLYCREQAVPRRVPTEKQRLAIEKMRKTLRKNHTCGRCGYYDESHGKSKYMSSVLLDTGEQCRYCDGCRQYLAWIVGRHALEERMHAMLSQDAPNFLVVDTETTGLPDHDGFQVVEIGIVDRYGAVVYHSLIKPDIPMPKGASDINGITDEMLANAPRFSEVWSDLLPLLSQYDIWCYNAEFDRDAILSSAERYHLEISKQVKNYQRWHCLMQEYAAYYGDYSDYWEDYRWQTLHLACDMLDVEGCGQHRAVGDALDTLAIMKALAGRSGMQIQPEQMPEGS